MRWYSQVASMMSKGDHQQMFVVRIKEHLLILGYCTYQKIKKYTLVILKDFQHERLWCHVTRNPVNSSCVSNCLTS